MAFSEFERKRCEKMMESYLVEVRPPRHIRKELDFGYRVVNQTVEFFEIRPEWRGTGKIELPVFKATYVKSRKHWKLYWLRGNLKWYSYEPHPIAKSLEEVIGVVREDEWACFYG